MLSIMLYIPVSKSELELETLSELMALLSDNVISQEYYHPGEGVQEWEIGQEDKVAAGMYSTWCIMWRVNKYKCTILQKISLRILG